MAGSSIVDDSEGILGSDLRGNDDALIENVKEQESGCFPDEVMASSVQLQTTPLALQTVRSRVVDRRAL